MSSEELFRKGLQFLKEDRCLTALTFFERAASAERTPEILSYLGRCIAIERGQTAEAVKLCEEAINQDSQNPVHYLNLGIVYLKDKKKQEAVEIFRKGLSIGDVEDIKILLDSIGTRKKPFFPFLPRENFLNRCFGLLLSRLRLR